MKRAIAGMALALTVLTGCATRTADGPPVPFDRIGQAVVIGQSSKAQVLAALGPATAIRFDSGYEVWRYHYGPARGDGAEDSAEFVILFDPQGIVRKTRQREPGPSAP